VILFDQNFISGLLELGLKTRSAEIHHDDRCSAVTIRAIGLAFTLLIDWHLEVLASAPSFRAVSAATHDGLTACNPAPSMKQLPARACSSAVVSIQSSAVFNSGTYTPKPFKALFSFNWETSQFVMQSYIQQPCASAVADPQVAEPTSLCSTARRH
jgi:hypothetical protein